jgi:hypothetical protein
MRRLVEVQDSGHPIKDARSWKESFKGQTYQFIFCRSNWCSLRKKRSKNVCTQSGSNTGNFFSRMSVKYEPRKNNRNTLRMNEIMTLAVRLHRFIFVAQCSCGIDWPGNPRVWNQHGEFPAGLAVTWRSLHPSRQAPDTPCSQISLSPNNSHVTDAIRKGEILEIAPQLLTMRAFRKFLWKSLVSECARAVVFNLFSAETHITDYVHMRTPMGVPRF